MIRQCFKVQKDGEEYRVGYEYSRLSGKTKLTVNGDEFVAGGKPFCIGVCRRESVLIGTSQAMLDVDKRGRAKLICRDADSIVEKDIVKVRSSK